MKNSKMSTISTLVDCSDVFAFARSVNDLDLEKDLLTFSSQLRSGLSSTDITETSKEYFGNLKEREGYKRDTFVPGVNGISAKEVFFIDYMLLIDSPSSLILYNRRNQPKENYDIKEFIPMLATCSRVFSRAYELKNSDLQKSLVACIADNIMRLGFNLLEIEYQLRKYYGDLKEKAGYDRNAFIPGPDGLSLQQSEAQEFLKFVGDALIKVRVL